MTEIICKNVTLGYGGHSVVQKLDLEISKGDYLCVVGENGVGKSTFIKTLLGLQPVLRGEIGYSESISHRDIGYLPQQSEFQKDFPATVREIVLSGCLGKKGLFSFYNVEDKKRAAKAMDRMDISSLENRCYRELSGGQQQRVLFARALCSAGKILILDEPQAGLDPKATAEMYELVNSLNREDGITIIMVTHDISVSVKYASHILHLSHTPLFFGTTSEYMASEVGKSFLRSGGHSHE